MLIYRVNRVPDKLHVALLDLLGIELHGPTAARTHVRFRLAAPPDQPGRDPRRARPRSRRCGRPPTSRSCSRSRADFSIPPLRPVAYVVERGGAVQGDRGGRWRRPAPGSGPPSVRAAAPGRRRALPGLRGRPREPAPPSRDRRLGGARRRRRPRGPAAAAGRSARAAAAGPRRTCSPTAPAASTTAPARSSSNVRRSPAVAAIGGRRLRWLRCRIDTATRAGAEPAPPTRIRPRSTRSPRRRWALSSASSTPRSETGEWYRHQRRHAWTGCSRSASRPVLPLADGQTLEVRRARR